MYPLGPIFHGSGLNITVMSLNGKLDVGLISLPELLPDLWDLADDFAVGDEGIARGGTLTRSGRGPAVPGGRAAHGSMCCHEPASPPPDPAHDC